MEDPIVPEVLNDPLARGYERRDQDNVTINLPDGWTKQIHRRLTGRTGSTGRNFDVYLLPPKGKKLRSVVELMKFIKANPTVPINPKLVNMERNVDSNDKTPEKLSGTTLRLIQFVEAIKRGEMVDVDDFTNAKPKEKATKQIIPAASPISRPAKKEPAQQVQKIPPKLAQFNAAISRLLPQEPLKQYEKNPPTNLSHRSPPVLSNHSILPQANQQRKRQNLEARNGESIGTNMNMLQAIKLERLLVEHPSIPTADQASQWASELGISYTNMQQWIRHKWFNTTNGGKSNNDLEDSFEDEDEFVPSKYVRVVMDDRQQVPMLNKAQRKS